MNSNLISPEIFEYYFKIENIENFKNAEQFFNVNRTLHFKNVYKLIQNGNPKDFSECEYKDFLTMFTKLRSIFVMSLKLVKKTEIYEFNLEWVNHDLNKLVCCTGNEQSVANIENLLVLTSTLEFALGSVYSTLSGKKPPHLLRDLLATKELEEYFGFEAIFFFKVLLGSPKSINIRNIIWHGFPTPQNIPTYYTTILLIAMHTLGHRLNQEKLILKYRTKITDFSAWIAPISTELSNKKDYEIDELQSIFAHSTLIPSDYLIYWRQLLLYFKENKYSKFVLLILPQIELILRLKYAKINDFDVSAKLDEYYITMDTIFEPTVPGGEMVRNKLLAEEKSLTNGALQLLYDLFSAPKGPRLRDKVSHGEVDLEALNNPTLCQILLILSVHLLTNGVASTSITRYESKFHLNSSTKRALNEAIESVRSFSFTYGGEQQRLQTNLIEKKVKIFLRRQKECVFMLTLLKVAEFVTKTCRNYEEAIVQRKLAAQQLELHSKRRRTLEKLLNSMPSVCSTLSLILKCSITIFESLQNMDCEVEVDASNYLQRFLKHVLKIMENLVKYSHQDSNEWIKATELCAKFEECYARLYLKWSDELR